MPTTSLVLNKPHPTINFGRAVIQRIFSTHQLQCIQDEVPSKFFFNSLESALSFQKFIKIYVGDRAPGNSYGGYFLNWEESEPTPCLPPLSTNILDKKRISEMTGAICSVRLCLNGFKGEWPPTDLVQNATPIISSRFGINSFCFDEAKLPPRLSPETFGDLVRVVEDPALRRIDGFFISSLGESVVIAIQNPREGLPELVAVNRRNVMKIFNYRRDIQYPPGFQAAELAFLERARENFESIGARKLEEIG